jgi:predicted O-methyltransferase YrrM
MDDTRWTDVDNYIAERLLPRDSALEDALFRNAASGLPPIDVSPAQGMFLQLLIRISGAKRILEIGTLGGYSTIWMGRALPADGRIVTLEYVPKHAETARANIERAGLAAQVEVQVGAALDLLPALEGPFDLVFIDADKPNNPAYLEHALRLSRPGTVIVLDNVVRDGEVANAQSRDRSVLGARAAFDLLHDDPRLDSTALQTVGLKGWDGFIMGVVKAP